METRDAEGGGTVIYRTSVLLFGAGLVDSVVGSGYWVLAARGLPTEALGQGAAGLSLMTGVSGLVAGGAGLTLIERLPLLREGAEWRRVVLFTTGAAMVATAVVLVAAMAFLPGRSAALAVFGGPLPLMLLLAGSLAWTVGRLVDQICVAEASAGTVFVRNVLFAVGKLAMLGGVVALGLSGPLWMVGGWVIAAVVVTVIVAVWRLPRLVPVGGSSAGRSATPISGLLRSYGGHQVATLSGIAISSGIPLLVAAGASSEQNAFFHIAWALEGLVSFALTAVGLALFAAGRRWPDKLGDDLNRAAAMAGLVVTVVCVGYLTSADRALDLLGAAYREGAGPLVGLLVFASVPQAVIYLTMGVLRARARLREAAVLSAATCTAAITVTALLLPGQGITAAGWGLLGARSAAAILIVSFLLFARARGRRWA